MRSRRHLLLLGFSLLVFSILACSINVGGPAYPAQAIPVSTQAVGELDQSIQTSVAGGALSGTVTLVITQEQMTSYLAFKLASQSNPILYDPQVLLQDGQIQIFGTARKGMFTATVKVVLTAGVDAQGHLQIELTSADFGPLPVPTRLKEAITAFIQEAYTGSLGPVATGFRIESIEVASGAMTITGKIK